jgi:cardiolipin synthase
MDADWPSHIPCVTSGAYPPRSGNAVQPLLGAVETFRRIGAAVDEARHSIWLTVAFVSLDFRMPDGRGLFDLLDRAAARGLDVRVIFWRPNPESSGYGTTFAGLPDDHALLEQRNAGFQIRWDRAPNAHCQHQKSWLIDAGENSETAFVGGINLSDRAMRADGRDRQHDMYVEITGPSASDVHHNFVQRWNEASERDAPDGSWGPGGQNKLAFPSRPSLQRGDSHVQIQRMIAADRYSDPHPAPLAAPFPIATGERSIFDQYLLAIDTARRSVYIENQAIPIPVIAERLEAALKGGVEIVLLLPADPEDSVRTARATGQNTVLFDQLAALGRYDSFGLVGLAGRDAQGILGNIYVHAKAMLIDDSFATIGSCNLHRNSLYGHSEINAAIWDPAVVHQLRCRLLDRHLGRDTAHLDDAAALRLYRQIAADNRQKRDHGNPDWQGGAFSLDPAAYGA